MKSNIRQNRKRRKIYSIEMAQQTEDIDEIDETDPNKEQKLGNLHQLKIKLMDNEINHTQQCENGEKLDVDCINDTNDISLENQNQYQISQNLFLHYLNSNDKLLLEKKMNPKFINSIFKLIDNSQIPLNTLLTNGYLKNETNEINHKKFSKDEDNMLKNVVEIFGPKNWKLIQSFIPGRTKKQCRDRYMNYLAPGFIHSEWTLEEDKLLSEKYKIYGPKWTFIRQFFPTRTANSIKNRFTYNLRQKNNLFKCTANEKRSSNVGERNKAKLNANGKQKDNGIFDNFDIDEFDEIFDFGTQNSIFENFWM